MGDADVCGLTQRPREDEGPGGAAASARASKRPCLLPHPDLVQLLLQLFPVQSSEVVLKRGGREAGGAGAGSSSFSVRAGEKFTMVVAIKTPLGPVIGPHVLGMMQEIHLLPDDVMQMTGEPHFSAETGEASFIAHIDRAGDFEVSAAVRYSGASHRIGQQVRVKVAPGAMRFASLDVKGSAEVGEQVQLVLKMSDKDVFGNTIELPLSASAQADLAALSFQGTWNHEADSLRFLRKAWAPLNLSQPVVVLDGVLVAEAQLLLPGKHAFRIDTHDQTLAAEIEISPGIPHSMRLIGEGKPHVLQRRRWCSRVMLLNRHDAAANITWDQVSAELVPISGNSGRTYPLRLEAVTCEDVVRGCSLSDVELSAMVPDLKLFLPETDDAPRAGTYRLQVKRASDGCELTCDPSTIHLDLPLDPAAWTSQDLAQRLRLDGLLASTANDVVKDEFDAEIDGKDLIQRGPQTAWSRLKDGLFLGRRFSNQKEKDDAEARIRGFAKLLFEKHTLAGLGKGKYRSSVAKSISESDLNLEANSFDTGGYSEIFRGHYEGQAVAVKIPLVKKRGLEVSDTTAGMMQEVERELDVTRKCKHPHVVQVIGLMVGAGRIGIVMELCDTSLAKRIQASLQSAGTTNWAESVRLLMDGAAGLAFIHQQRGTTHGDLKPDNLLIQEGRLKVADFGLATVRSSITNLTGGPSRKGTTFFMPPEKVISEGSDATSTDVWAFGCCIANLVTGRSPFSEVQSDEALMWGMRQKKPVYARAHVLRGCPPKLLELLDRCTRYDPALRPTMTEVGQELRQVLQSIQSQDGFGLPALWQERGCLLDSSERLVACPAGSRDYALIKARVEEEMRDQMGTSPTVVKVEMNATTWTGAGQRRPAPAVRLGEKEGGGRERRRRE